MFKCTVLSLVLIPFTLSAIVYGPLKPKPEKFSDKEGCYISELDMVLPYNQTLPSKMDCMEYRCDQIYIHYVTCGVAVILPPCKGVEDKEKPYPECCTRISCPLTGVNDTSKAR